MDGTRTNNVAGGGAGSKKIMQITKQPKQPKRPTNTTNTTNPFGHTFGRASRNHVCPRRAMSLGHEREQRCKRKREPKQRLLLPAAPAAACCACCCLLLPAVPGSSSSTRMEKDAGALSTESATQRTICRRTSRPQTSTIAGSVCATLQCSHGARAAHKAHARAMCGPDALGQLPRHI